MIGLLARQQLKSALPALIRHSSNDDAFMDFNAQLRDQYAIAEVKNPTTFKPLDPCDGKGAGLRYMVGKAIEKANEENIGKLHNIGVPGGIKNQYHIRGSAEGEETGRRRLEAGKENYTFLGHRMAVLFAGKSLCGYITENEEFLQCMEELNYQHFAHYATEFNAPPGFLGLMPIFEETPSLQYDSFFGSEDEKTIELSCDESVVEHMVWTFLDTEGPNTEKAWKEWSYDYLLPQTTTTTTTVDLTPVESDEARAALMEHAMELLNPDELDLGSSSFRETIAVLQNEKVPHFGKLLSVDDGVPFFGK